MPKRKRTEDGGPALTDAPRRSTRVRPSAPTPAVESKTAKPVTSEKGSKRSTAKTKAKDATRSKATKEVTAKTEEGKTTDHQPPKTKPSPASSATIAASDEDRWYWLMKAEPETRFENGTDVKFSIDDLKSRTEPEPWDGIRNYVARNNLRSMKKGELAFFYHSNCKEPGIVGTMEIVQEHSPDLSAHNSKAPYYDPKSKPDDPKWSVVHVRYRSKFVQQIGLQELKAMGKPGSPLENMQMLKQSRLSVSRVSPSEWEYLMGVVKERGGETE